jgi:glycerol-3-phosphate dehydrogenase
MAEKAINLIFSKLARKKQPSISSQTPIFGGDFSTMEQLLAQLGKQWGNGLAEEARYAMARNYGTEWQRVLSYGEPDVSMLATIGSSTVLGAEVVHAVREEMAMTLSDAVFRRTDLGTVGGIDREQIDTCGRIMARELGWEDKRLKEEIEQVETHIARCGFICN